MKRTRFLRKDEHQIFTLPEDMTGSQLKSYARKNKIPLLRQKMRRTKFPAVPKVPKKEKKLSLVCRYLKDNPEMKRTKFSN